MFIKGKEVKNNYMMQKSIEDKSNYILYDFYDEYDILSEENLLDIDVFICFLEIAEDINEDSMVRLNAIDTLTTLLTIDNYLKHLSNKEFSEIKDRILDLMVRNEDDVDFPLLVINIIELLDFLTLTPEEVKKLEFVLENINDCPVYEVKHFIKKLLEKYI